MMAGPEHIVHARTAGAEFLSHNAEAPPLARPRNAANAVDVHTTMRGNDYARRTGSSGPGSRQGKHGQCGGSPSGCVLFPTTAAEIDRRREQGKSGNSLTAETRRFHSAPGRSRSPSLIALPRFPARPLLRRDGPNDQFPPAADWKGDPRLSVGRHDESLHFWTLQDLSDSIRMNRV